MQLRLDGYELGAQPRLEPSAASRPEGARGTAAAPHRTVANPRPGKIRPFGEADIPAVVALMELVFPENHWTSRALCEAYVRDIFLDNPWRDDELPSWVAEEDGQVCGFCGVVPRRMLFRGREVRVAVSTALMVHPERRGGLAALALAKRSVSGPQDLTFADGATEAARRMWCGLGGIVPPLYNLHWIRPLRPMQHVLSVLAARGALPRALALAARPLAGLADALAPHMGFNRFLDESSELVEQPLDAAQVAVELPALVPRAALTPLYAPGHLEWLLDRAARNTDHGDLRARAVWRGEQLVGWYIYYVRAAGPSEVLQVAAREGYDDALHLRLLLDAWRHGATALRGRLEPRMLGASSAGHYWLRMDGPYTLVHSRHPAIVDAIQRGDAFLSRLDGEWWIRFATG